MTDEEIIRELKNVEKEYENKPTPTFSINISSMARSCRQHIEQLVEGRKATTEKISELEKENEQLKAEKQQIQEQVKQILLDDNAEIGDIKKLVGMDWYDVKEIEQLKYNLKCRDDELAESKAEIKQIIERERVVPEHYLVEMIDKYKELKAQVEKLKCCGNCKWNRIENGGEIFCDCVGDCIDFSKWEQAK